MNYHNPVLLHPSVDYLVVDPAGTYVDVTFGGGGHSRAIMEKLTDGRLIAFDQDADSHANLIEDDRFQFVPSNFKNLTRFLQYHKAYPVDGILADLGISSHQIDTPDRGFSYREDGELDMRMNSQNGISAKELVNEYDEAQLSRVFYTYGELSEGRRLAQRIFGLGTCLAYSFAFFLLYGCSRFCWFARFFCCFFRCFGLWFLNLWIFLLLWSLHFFHRLLLVFSLGLLLRLLLGLLGSFRGRGGFLCRFLRPFLGLCHRLFCTYFGLGIYNIIDKGCLIIG